MYFFKPFLLKLVRLLKYLGQRFLIQGSLTYFRNVGGKLFQQIALKLQWSTMRVQRECKIFQLGGCWVADRAVLQSHPHGSP